MDNQFTIMLSEEAMKILNKIDPLHKQSALSFGLQLLAEDSRFKYLFNEPMPVAPSISPVTPEKKLGLNNMPKRMDTNDQTKQLGVSSWG